MSPFTNKNSFGCDTLHDNFVLPTRLFAVDIFLDEDDDAPYLTVRLEAADEYDLCNAVSLWCSSEGFAYDKIYWDLH